MKKQKSAGNRKIRVGLTDKSPLVQAALKYLFAEDPRFDLVAEFTDGESFLNSVDACLLDVAVIAPGDGKYILDQLQARNDALPIVVYTGAEGNSIPVQVMAHGGAAFVSKSEQLEHSNLILTAGGGCYDHLDGPAAGAGSLRQAEQCWKQGADPVAFARDHHELARAFESFQGDADQLYPDWRQQLERAA